MSIGLYMTKLKLMFFVNGSQGSAAGIRAQMLAQRFPTEWEIQFQYRPIKKWQGILPFIKAALHFKPDIIYVVDTAYTGVLAAYFTQKLLKCKLVVDSGDVAFELAKSVGTYSKTQLALINWVERTAIQRADCFIVRGSYHKELLEAQGSKRVEFIPDGIDIKEVEEVNSSALREKLGLTDNLVVGLIGTMAWSERHQMCYGWDIVEALGLLPNYPVKALLVGDGEGRKILENRAKELGILDRVVFTGQLPYKELPQYLCAMDVCVSTQSNDLVGMVRTTGKLPLYLAYGKYVIATDVGEAKRVLPDVGYLLPYKGVRDNEHPARLAKHLQELLNEPHYLKVNTKAKQVAKDNFDYEILAARLKSYLSDL
ncbi:MAG: hypothetical protein DCF19_00850 [Pseudanabaena frigida]|uniref:Glycosyltransferase subfamily 4-like N-terminal domain-containing protein n=1 Tax=Pseudanabaena frigida TaxID=945775 RepID=A0A2W4WKT5_9CYAN|nr:MAG: hypothetical protein DCF19_00850 [Pseudanabaena frigida]